MAEPPPKGTSWLTPIKVTPMAIGVNRPPPNRSLRPWGDGERDGWPPSFLIF